MIRFEAVEKRYPGGSLAVAGLSFTAPAGAVTVLVGPSGCGKTTTLRMVNRMVQPTEYCWTARTCAPAGPPNCAAASAM